MRRGWFLLAAGVTLVVLAFALSALATVLQDCNYVGLGLGRPMCAAARGGRDLALAIWLAVLAASSVITFLLRPRSTHHRY